jgi:phage/plasmid-like protein (TIGR03299 family)
MAHELTTRANGFTEMAFVGATPWHKLGQQLDQDASFADWRVAAGMDWTIEQTPAQFTTPNGELQTVPERFVQYRSDTLAPLSVVSTRYKPVQPAEVLEFFSDLVDNSGFRLHTAGTLFGGKRLWALAETGKFAEVSKDDGIGGFLLLSTSCDKTLATTARFTTVRVVCNNTLGMATANGADCVSFTHATKFDAELMKTKLGAAVESFGAFMEMSKFLQRRRINEAQAKTLLARILDAPYTEEGLPQESRPFKRIMDLFNGEAKGIEVAGGTKWGLLNAVTEYYDHHRPSRTDDARLNSAWFGKGDAMKAKAVAVLTP